MYGIKVGQIIIATLLLCAATFGHAASANTDDKQQELRQIFVKAEYAAGLRKSNDYHKLYEQLDGYPLQPYVELAYLQSHTTIKNKDWIRDFLARFYDTPLEWPLRKKWLHHLARRDKYELFMQDYKPSSDVALLCFNLRFQLKTGVAKESIFHHVDKLWLAKKSQPKACDPLFDLWRDAGQRTDEKVWQRLVLAASQGDHTLIPFLKRISPESEQYLADLWYETRRRPQTVGHLRKFPNNSDKEKQILLYGVKRLIWRDRKLALRSWKRMQHKFTFTQVEKNSVAKVFAIRLAKAGDDDAPQWLELLPPEEITDDVVQWRIADSLRRGLWNESLAILQSLPPALASKEIWSYWLARSLDKTGATEDAKRFFEIVAKERHYYGFLAASMIGQAPNLAHTPLSFSVEELKFIDDNPAAIRALEFRQLGRLSEARREWNYFNRKLNRQEKLAAAKWANQNGWYDRAIFTLAKQKYLDDVDLRFPLAFKETLSFHAVRNNIPPSLAFAITRRESSFMPDAYSSAGAYGLMQMLPSTAKFIAKKQIKRRKLFDSDTNVQYGTDYLKYLLENVEGNEVIAAAAYNAGINRVRRWLKTDQPLPADIWIETIPYKETREYVKSVMAYRQIYSELLGNTVNNFKPLTTMQIGI